MNKRLLYALLLIGLMVILLVLNKGHVNVNLVVTTVRMSAAFAYLGFAALGIAIGILLK
jgi:uncharacterized integral membrane protein